MNIFIAMIEGREAILTPEESWHCSRVLRHQAGEQIQVIDGMGNFYRGTLSLVSDKCCKASITAGPETQDKRNYSLHLAIAPTKQIDRIEWMVEKAVEMGLDEISFIQCKNSERTVLKIDRIQKIVESAVKQSLQARIPQINALQAYSAFIKERTESQKWIAYCGQVHKTSVKEVNFKNNTSLVLIGPEGDFTPEEVDLAMGQGFKVLSLGDNRLRTETAGLVVCQAASLLS